MPEKYPILINGQFRTTKTEMAVINPFDGSVVAVTYQGGADELDEAVDGGEKAFEKLKAWPAYKKAEVLQKISDGIKKDAEALARIIALEAGKPIREARTEALRAANTFQVALEEAKRLEGELIPLDIMAGAEGRLGLVRRFPVGVVLGVSPFNFPLNLVAHKVAPAMACGCPIIIKPASKTPLSALMLGRIITEAGYVDGGVSVVPSSGADAEKLLDDPRIRKLTFTGSAAVGWRLKARAGEKKITLELGGNAGVIIHDDADVDYAAKRCAVGAFSFAGQICISVQRIYVHARIFHAFSRRFLEAAGALNLGNPLDEATELGPMIEEGALTRTEEWVKEAVSSGAQLLCGGRRQGSFFEPTVLTNTRPEMKVCSEEVFAPVAVLEQYEKFEDAVARINSGRYGLQAGVFTKDVSRIFHAYERLEVGGVVANDIPTFRVDSMPYGGVKSSGFGREGVKYAIEEMTERRLLVLKT